MKSGLAGIFSTKFLDPGAADLTGDVGISSEIEMIVAENNLKPVAVLVTHGHLDHTFSVRPLADGYNIPAYIHSEDRRFLSDPSGVHGPQFMQMIGYLTLNEPIQVVELNNGAIIDLVGITLGSCKVSSKFN